MPTKPKHTPGPHYLDYLFDFLDANLTDIAEATLYDVATVAGDAATLRRLHREGAAAPAMREALLARLDEWHSDNRNITRIEPQSVKLARAALRQADGEVKS